MNDQSIPRLKALLTKHEGYRADVYKDSVGHPTIGVGHNLDACPLPDGWVPPLTPAQVNQLLDHDTGVVIADLRRELPWFDQLDPVRQAVLCDMAFNMGWVTLSQFKNTLQCFEEGFYGHAADMMLQSKWATQVGPRATEDAEMTRTGLWPAV